MDDCPVTFSREPPVAIPGTDCINESCVIVITGSSADILILVLNKSRGGLEPFSEDAAHGFLLATVALLLAHPRELPETAVIICCK